VRLRPPLCPQLRPALTPSHAPKPTVGWYKNLDKLIHYVNAGTATHNVNLLYSTPASFAAAKLAQTTITWPLKTDDFMPYADGPHAMYV
jgi:hypothetical protein